MYVHVYTTPIFVLSVYIWYSFSSSFICIIIFFYIAYTILFSSSMYYVVDE